MYPGCIARDDLKLLPLFPPPKCWDYRCSSKTSLCHVGNGTWVLCMLGKYSTNEATFSAALSLFLFFSPIPSLLERVFVAQADLDLTGILPQPLSVGIININQAWLRKVCLFVFLSCCNNNNKKSQFLLQTKG